MTRRGICNMHKVAVVSCSWVMEPQLWGSELCQPEARSWWWVPVSVLGTAEDVYSVNCVIVFIFYTLHACFLVTIKLSLFLPFQMPTSPQWDEQRSSGGPSYFGANKMNRIKELVPYSLSNKVSRGCRINTLDTMFWYWAIWIRSDWLTWIHTERLCSCAAGTWWCWFKTRGFYWLYIEPLSMQDFNL